MKIRITTTLLIFSLLALPLLSNTGASAQYNGRKIVIFDDKVVNEKAVAVLESVGGYEIEPLPIIDGYSVALPNAAAERALEGRVGVSRIDDDVIVRATAKPPWAGGGGKGGGEQPPQTVEWGIDRIDADLAWGTSTGTASNVAVIDTGIDKTHPDLVANIKGGVNFVKKGTSVDPNKWIDDNGHGTHVAGIIAAANNSIGVVGVATEANLYGVKVLDRNGYGYLSDVIAGINWSVGNGMDVINMSLGTDSDIQSFHDAVDAAYAAGIVVVAAAGNDGADVDYPAAYSSVIAVAATDINNIRPYWSSIGPQVELAAPGVNIRSTWKGGTYKTISGTSMASPHAAGTAALVLAAPVLPGYDVDLDGIWDASEVRQVLKDKADDLGTAGFDNYYGFGLVDAEESVTGVQTN